MGLGGGLSTSMVINPYQPWNRDTSFGASDKFGHADYTEALKSAGTDPRNLAKRRDEVLDWLDNEGSSLLGSMNVKGSGGLYDQIANQKLGTALGRGGGTGDYFGHADWLQAMAMGKSDKEISDWATENQSKFRLGNAPDKMAGLYQQIQQRGKGQEGIMGALSGAADAFTQQGEDFKKSFADQQAAFDDRFKRFEEDRSAYENAQKQWQQRQMAATQQMQIQQMKAMNQKPVMQIMPGASGGGGMSTASHSRKRLATGLNIGSHGDPGPRRPPKKSVY